MTHPDSYFTFEKPRSNRLGNESPLLSPGSIEPPVPSTLLSTALSSAVLSPGSMDKRTKPGFGNTTEKSRQKALTPPQLPMPPSYRQGHRFGSALRRLSLAPLRGQRHSDEVDEVSEEQSVGSTSGYDGDSESLAPSTGTSSHKAWFSDDDTLQNPTAIFNRSDRRHGMSESSLNLSSEQLLSYSTTAQQVSRNHKTHQQPYTVHDPKDTPQPTSSSRNRLRALSPLHKTSNGTLLSLSIPSPESRPLSFLASEAQRVATPPASAEPRLDPFSISPRLLHSSLSPGRQQRQHYMESHAQIIPGGTSHLNDEDDMFRRKVNGDAMHSGGSGGGEAGRMDNGRIGNDEMSRVGNGGLDSGSLLDSDIPEHFPTSPLCPRNPKHKSKGMGVCPYHGRN